MNSEIEFDIDYQYIIEEPFIKGLLRILILSALKEGGKRGYQVYRYVIDRIRLRISLSTIYTLLKELREKNFIVSIEGVYHLTEKGMRTLEIFMRKYNDIKSLFI
ncbi:MAG: PadR family transcriptional regulator [Ignisphaera sp.]